MTNVWNVELKDIKQVTSEVRSALRDGSLLSQTALYKRGWTTEEIFTYLPRPDFYENPVIKGGLCMKVWEADDVIAIEQEKQLGRYKIQQESV